MTALIGYLNLASSLGKVKKGGQLNFHRGTEKLKLQSINSIGFRHIVLAFTVSVKILGKKVQTLQVLYM